MRKLIILFILIGATVHGQWPQGKGHAYIKLGSWNQQSNTTYDINGNSRELNGERSYFIPGVYARFGVTDKFTITGYLPYVKTNETIYSDGLNPSTFQEGVNIGDATIAFERLLYKSKKGHVIAAGLTFGIPLGDTDPNVGTGDGEFDTTFRLLAGSGYKIFNQTFYVKGHLGYTARSKGYINQIRSGLETGTTFGKLFVLGRLTSIKTERTLRDLSSTGGLFADFEKTTLGAEATYNINKNWGVSAGYSKFLSGKLLFNAPAYTYGVVYKY